MKEKISITINKKFLKEVDNFVDGLIIKNRSQAIEYIISKIVMFNKTAVVLAGGPENSLLNNEKKEFKPLMNVGNETIVENIVRTISAQGYKKIIVVSRDRPLSEIFKVLKNGEEMGVEIKYVMEKESNGSFDSLKLARSHLESNFLVVFCDLLLDGVDLNELWEEHVLNKGICTMLLYTSFETDKNGVAILEGKRILDFFQKPKGMKQPLCFASAFIASPEIFKYSGKSLEENLFPMLAKSSLMYGHITSKNIINAHSYKDVKEFLKYNSG
ncbi:MAG TPA: hypothetical protein ENN46_04325 [Candidatus Woesearchaeota archaeon]|nr:hypothetical protein [Candidatus Woesearchaeota archaeon]